MNADLLIIIVTTVFFTGYLMYLAANNTRQ